MAKMNKEMELNYKTLGASMFLASVCLYMAVGALFAFISSEDFYYQIPFSFLIQGVIVSMSVSIAWTLCFGLDKAWGFLTRYILIFIILLALSGISIVIPSINSIKGHFLWIISCFFASLAFVTGVSVMSIKYKTKTGIRSVLLWEIK
jgi:hypothetical protein